MDLIRNLFKGDKAIWIVFLLLCTISLIEVFSASSFLTYKSGNHWAPISSHLSILMVGAVIVLVTHMIPCKWFRLFVLLLPLSWLLLSVLFVLGSFTNGARRWLDLGFIHFQPSELAKMGIVIAVALILSRLQEEDGANKKAMKYILMITGITCAFIVTENLSTAMLICITVYLMMIIGRVPWKQLLKLGGVVAAILITSLSVIKFVPAQTWRKVGIHRMVTWQNRIDDFLNPQETPAAKFDVENNAQVAHANIAIATSNIIGKGPGNSIQRDFLSQAFSDFIYAIVIEELGLIGGAIVALLYIILLMRIGKIARNCDQSFYAFLVMGIGLMIVSQAVFNMMVAVGLAPVTGQPLPLISKGGTSTLINCAYIGMVLSISRHVNELKEKEAREEAEKAALMEAGNEGTMPNEMNSLNEKSEEEPI